MTNSIKSLICSLFILSSCSSQVVNVQKMPQTICQIQTSSFKLYIIDKQKYTSKDITLEKYNSLLKDDLRMLIIDKVNLINYNEALQLEIQCLRKFI